MTAAEHSARRRRRLPLGVRRARRWAFYVVVRGLVGGVRRLPRRVALWKMRGLAAVAWVTARRARATMLAQLARTLPAVDARERACIARRSMDRFAYDLVDMVRAERTVFVPEADAARLDEARAEGRGVVVLMGHLGAWELAGPVLARRCGRFAALTADSHNARLAQWMRAERSRRGITCFDRDEDVRSAARWLRDGGVLAVLADHRTRGADCDAPWFGGTAPTVTGPARLAQMAGAAILPVLVGRRGDVRVLEVGEPFGVTGTIEEATARCNAVLEEWIRRAPEEWTWFHDRFGSAPSRSSS